MRRRRSCILLVFATMGAIAQAGQNERLANDPEQSVALIQNLYTKVLSRHPVGVIRGADMTEFAPFLSRRLRHRIDLAAKCEADFYRKYPPNDLNHRWPGWSSDSFRVTTKWQRRAPSELKRRGH